MFDQVSKYKYTGVIVFFVVWMFLFDSNSIPFMLKQYNELQDLKQQEVFLESEIKEMRKEKEELFSSHDKLEKYARENYFFKHPDEDVFVFQ